MEKFLRDPIKVDFDSLYLDPNNPRLGNDELPGYENPKALIDPKLQEQLQKQAKEVYDVDTLLRAIESQGWMPIDNIVVWEPPKNKGVYIVVEGNTRTVALREARNKLNRETERLSKTKDSKRRRQFSQHDIDAIEESVNRLTRLVNDTKTLTVLPIDASNVEELYAKLPRVLAVRHIIGAKPWGNYAEDLWLLTRYEDLFSARFPKENLRWESELIAQIGAEASITNTTAKRKLLSASCFSHFKINFEEKLPADDQFEPTDYYLFELIVKKPFIREKLGLSDDSSTLHISESGEKAIFEWVFSKERTRTADDNPNVFFRHENILLWDQMKRYDEKHGTGFANRFDVFDWENAPTMASVEAEYLAHKTRKQPTDILEHLLRSLGDIDTKTMIEEGPFLADLLEKVVVQASRSLKMVKAVLEE